MQSPRTTTEIPGRRPREAIYQMLEDGIRELKEQLGGLPSPIEGEGIWGDIWYQETHNSTALEGNTLVLKQVEALLREGKAVFRRLPTTS